MDEPGFGFVKAKAWLVLLLLLLLSAQQSLPACVRVGACLGAGAMRGCGAAGRWGDGAMGR